MALRTGFAVGAICVCVAGACTSPVQSLSSRACAAVPAAVEPAALAAPNVLPSYLVDKVEATPDYFQESREYGGFPDGGTQYCGPASVSNGLVWLARAGYRNLLPRGSSVREQQHRLIATLGSAAYMGVGSGGIGPVGVTRGLRRYLDVHGYASATVLYDGWRPVEPEFMHGSTVPRLRWLQESLVGSSIVWLNLGWYEHQRDTDSWRRVGGHWVTLVGYGHDGQRPDPRVLLVNDPATPHLKTEVFMTEELMSGSLTGEYSGLPRSAQGYLRSSSKNAIIDGAVVLQMQPRVPGLRTLGS